ncbi:hypothetical protein KEJ50_03345 [Candidatus Bathyarchaeota archaeon]|nr:hypothetical protein [Candidatus Bathyarchaeota archaeon]
MSLKEAFIKRGDKTFYLTLLEVENAVFGFFHDGKVKVGTLALALPKTIAASVSSILIGNRFVVTAKILAEKLALKFNKIAFASIAINEVENEALKASIELINKI